MGNHSKASRTKRIKVDGSNDSMGATASLVQGLTITSKVPFRDTTKKNNEEEKGSSLGVHNICGRNESSGEVKKSLCLRRLRLLA